MEKPTPQLGILLLIGFICAMALPLLGKSKDDVVVMKNGDRFTGEIKGLERGQLIFKSSYMADSVRLNWDEVEQLLSRDQYIVGFANGNRVSGRIVIGPSTGVEPRTFGVVGSTKTNRFDHSDVVLIQQREASFWDQLTGSIDYGFSFASANSHLNSSLGVDLSYSTAKNSIDVGTSSQLDTQSEGENARRFTFDAQYGRQLTPRFVALGLFGLLRSNQQDLDLRSTYGIGFGRKLIRSSRVQLLAFGGSAYTHEQYFPQPGAQPSYNLAEGVFGVQFSVFRFRTLDLRSGSIVFPSFSEPGRVRFGSQSNLRIELIRNFFWGLQLYENYDSRPPVKANKNDLGVTTSLGWTF